MDFAHLGIGYPRLLHEPLHDGEGDGVDVFRVRAESHLGLAQAAGVLADAVGAARALGVVPRPSQRFSINKKKYVWQSLTAPALPGPRRWTGSTPPWPLCRRRRGRSDLKGRRTDYSGVFVCTTRIWIRGCPWRKKNNSCSSNSTKNDTATCSDFLRKIESFKKKNL